MRPPSAFLAAPAAATQPPVAHHRPNSTTLRPDLLFPVRAGSQGWRNEWKGDRDLFNRRASPTRPNPTCIRRVVLPPGSLWPVLPRTFSSRTMNRGFFANAIARPCRCGSKGPRGEPFRWKFKGGDRFLHGRLGELFFALSVGAIVCGRRFAGL